MTKVRCRGCREYVPRDEAISVSLGSFCSSECLSEHSGRAKRRVRRKETRPSKQKSHTPPKVRSSVIDRDNGCCRVCAGPGGHVHHVDYRSEGGSDSETNLVLLCHECHALVHSSKVTWKPLLETYLWGLYAHDVQGWVYEIARELHRSGDLSELQVARLGLAG